MTKSFVVSLVFFKKTATGESHSLRYGIVQAVSADEAMGRMLREEWPKSDGWTLLLRGVVEAADYQYLPEVPTTQQPKGTE